MAIYIFSSGFFKLILIVCLLFQTAFVAALTALFTLFYGPVFYPLLLLSVAPLLISGGMVNEAFTRELIDYQRYLDFFSIQARSGCIEKTTNSKEAWFYPVYMLEFFVLTVYLIFLYAYRKRMTIEMENGTEVSLIAHPRGQKVSVFIAIGVFLVFFALNIGLYWKTEDHDLEYDQAAYILIQVTNFLCSVGAFVAILLKLYKVTDEGICYAIYSLAQIAVIILFAFIAGSGIHYAWDPPLLKVVWFLDALYVPWAVFCFILHFKGREYSRQTGQRVEPMPPPDG
ncbi:hypothetical protein QR680_008007 [Steinernema hermaphroditum]|uniref:Uncharacterized protein n=1 Tax=Steinernema hermaphroditum TaxID=289476 RepID=A0AA39IH56_9BILA|nr:hypothetical protein QR680_008007 [Steinernema hermaphroditum]